VLRSFRFTPFRELFTKQDRIARELKVFPLAPELWCAAADVKCSAEYFEKRPPENRIVRRHTRPGIRRRFFGQQSFGKVGVSWDLT
jgi:hypothetical protein